MKKVVTGLHVLAAMGRWIQSARHSRSKALRTGWMLAAVRRGDFRWPDRVAPWVRGQRTLDVGCGRNLQSIGFVGAGVKSYTGLDPRIDLDSTILKDSRHRWSRRTDCGMSLRDIMNARSQVNYVQATVAEFAKLKAAQFDALVMHNVTEHLSDIERDFVHFAELLRHGGVIVFRHPNYYAWHGHHCKPRTISEIDPKDEAQAAVLDWAHTRLNPATSPVHAWIEKTQNRIRLDDLRALVARNFQIECWEETESPKEQGIDRLTPEILQKYPEFSRRDLATKCVFVVARKSMVEAQIRTAVSANPTEIQDRSLGNAA